MPDCFTATILTGVPVPGFVRYNNVFIVVIPVCYLAFTFMSDGEADKSPPSPPKESGTVEDPVRTPPFLQNRQRAGSRGCLRSSPLARRGPDLVVKTCCHWPPSLSQKGSMTLPVCFLLLLRRRNHRIHIQRTGRAQMDLEKKTLQPATAAPHLDLATTPEFCQPLPVPFPTCEGPVRAPAGPPLLCLGFICLCLGTSTHRYQRLGCGPDGAPPFQTWTSLCLHQLLLVYNL